MWPGRRPSSWQKLLTYRQRSISATLGGNFPHMRASLWHSEAGRGSRSTGPDAPDDRKSVQGAILPRK